MGNRRPYEIEFLIRPLTDDEVDRVFQEHDAAYAEHLSAATLTITAHGPNPDGAEERIRESLTRVGVHVRDTLRREAMDADTH